MNAPPVGARVDGTRWRRIVGLALVCVLVSACDQADYPYYIKAPCPTGQGGSTAVQLVELKTRRLFVPRGFSLPAALPGGAFVGAVLRSAQGHLAGFVSERPPLQAEASAAEVVATAVGELGATGTLANIASLTLSDPLDTVITQHRLTVAAATTPTALANALAQRIGVNTAGGSIGGLPAAPAGSPTDTAFRLGLTAIFYDATTVILIVSVAPESAYADHATSLLALGDGTNVRKLDPCPGPAGDAFTVAGPSLADYLFVVDNSGSMSAYQTAVSQAASDFFAEITGSAIDFQVGVITTDSDVVRSGSFTNDLVTFQGDVAVGVIGSGIETGILFAERALASTAQGDASDGTVTLLGHPRAGAGLSVIMLSDEPDQYAAVAGGPFDPASNLFVARGHRVFGIVDPNQAALSQYDDLAQATGGSTADIKDVGSFPAIMQDIAASSAGGASQFRLSHIPLSSTLAVRVNGAAVANSSQDGWRYVRVSNSLVFRGTALPAENDRVEASYLWSPDLELGAASAARTGAEGATAAGMGPAAVR